MHLLHKGIALISLSILCAAKQWPYDRYHGIKSKTGHYEPQTSAPEFQDEVHNHFGQWFHHIVDRNDPGHLQELFINGSVPRNASFKDILHNLNVPEKTPGNGTILPPHVPLPWPQQQANALFTHLPYPIDPRCTSDRSKWWFRTYDGSCNWLKVGEMSEGQYGTAKSRDYGQHYYADGISKPREGPNPRAVSNAFFRRKKTLYYEHTPLLLGLVEFIMHDITWSQDSSSESINVPMPGDEDYFFHNTTFRVWRTEPVPGTGSSPENPRENVNRATTWLDVSSLYGSTPEVARALRSFNKGKLLAQDLVTRGTKRKASYLPFNTMDVPTRTQPGIDTKTLFAGGDPRTNEDWVMLSVHTLLLREHNRLCDLLAEKHPEYDEEQLYQTVRLILSAKFSLIGNAYQMAYFKNMTWPRDDGFPLYREMSGKNFLQINPANTYPWPIATKGGKPTVVSAEMAVVYRFHEFIIKSFPIKDALNETLWDQLVFDTGFNATGFIDAGLENVVRGIVSTSIPNFKSGVEESFRSAGKNSKAPFDIVTWSIVHEREQGLPTFNNYFRAYNEQKPKVTVPIRERFEDFSSDPQMVSELKRLYNTPDDVDLVVGCQLDESIFPHATIPTSALIISLFSLISMGNSDRFSIGFAAMRCLLVDKPWDCHPSNALEELLWKPMPREGFPNFRFYDTFWMTELDFQAHGQNLLWRIVTENSEIKCLQKNPLFPMDPVTNPILCTLPSQRVDYALLASTGAEVTLALFRQHKAEIFMSLIALALGIVGYKIIKPRAKGYPHVLYGYPILGKALDFQKDPKKLLLEGFQKYGSSGSKTFGIHIASLTHYVLSEPEDLQMMLEDNPYELKFNLSKFFEAINMPIILRKENFASNIHTNLIRTHLSDPNTIQALGKTMEVAAEHFLHNNPLVTAVAETKRYETLSGYMDRYITSISARCMVGADAYKHPELIDMFLKFNLDVDKSMGLASFVPSFLSFIAERPLNKSYNKFRDIFIPIIKRRRADLTAGQDGLLDFMPFILEVIADDKRASDLIAITVWIGLRNLQITATSTVLDIINVPDLAPKIASSLSNATIANLHTFGPDASKNTPWSLLRSSMFESIRLCGPATGPARIISSPHPVALASDPSVHLPPKQVATLSSYYSHRLPVNYGEDAAEYRAGRFVEHDPEIGSTRFITWGLKGPHTCPGRWFTQEAICVMIKALLERYEFAVERRVGDGEKYVYHAGVVTRKEVPVVVRRKV